MKRNVLLLTLAIGLLGAPAAMAQSNLGLKGLGVAIGYVSPENFDGTLGFGVFADHGFLAPRWGLESRLDYWSQSEGAYGVEATVSDVVLGARTKYYFETKSTVRPFAGAGLGMHFLHSEVVTPPQFGFPETRFEDSTTKLGLDLGGGIAAPLGPRTNFLGEVWYGIVSDVSQFSLRAGLSYALK